MRKNIDLETKLAIIEGGQNCEKVHAWHAILHASGHTTEEIETFWAKYRDDLYWGYTRSWFRPILANLWQPTPLPSPMRNTA